jgi:hypothetical protein
MGLGYSINLIPREAGIETFRRYDIVYIPVGWAQSSYGDYDVLEEHADDYHTYVNEGGGLFIDQPNPYGQPGGIVTPNLLPLPITFNYQYNLNESPLVIVDTNHDITKNLPPEDMPYPADQLTNVDPAYQILVKGNATNSPSLVVGQYGNGRILVQAGHPSPTAYNPFSDEIYNRMVKWVAGNNCRYNAQVFLPSINNVVAAGATPTHTPTATVTFTPTPTKMGPPPIIPNNGAWYGTTSAGGCIHFDVSSNKVYDLVAYIVPSNSNACCQVIYPGSYYDDIVNNHFGSSSDCVKGNFTSNTQASGTWKNSLGQTGSWSANWGGGYCPRCASPYQPETTSESTCPLSPNCPLKTPQP